MYIYLYLDIYIISVFQTSDLCAYPQTSQGGKRTPQGAKEHPKAQKNVSRKKTPQGTKEHLKARKHSPCRKRTLQDAKEHRKTQLAKETFRVLQKHSKVSQKHSTCQSNT